MNTGNLCKSCIGTKWSVGRKMLLAVLLLSSMLAAACSKAPDPPDYNLYADMRAYAETKLNDSGATVRQDIADLFQDYVLDLAGLFRAVFGSAQLEVHLSSYESPRIAVASLSQFEVPPASGTFTDFAFTVRPAANLRAPILHGDAVKGMAGSDSSFSMDFYDLSGAIVDLEEFFGEDQLAVINEALDLVEPYQRTGEDRGKYIEHIKEQSSGIYRIEIDESYIGEDGEEARQQYYAAALDACKLFMDAYFTSLDRIAVDNETALTSAVIDGTDAFIDTLYENDFAAGMGKQLFGDDFDSYYLDGFWRDGYYGAGL
ncbi:MAG: hypothetical protein GY868_10415 [Deltaproteobacteria bacterium]|nr:hypothetical protein [Deltaproteobacteria bacterium]